MENKVINLIHIEDYFYSKSGSSMSSIYKTNWIRFDWGKVQIALSNGYKINIRPATDKEMLKAYRMLEEVNNNRLETVHVR